MAELYELQSLNPRLNEIEYELFETKQEYQRYKEDMKCEVTHR